MCRDLYQIVVELEGINHIKIIKKMADDTLLLVWSFSLPGDDQPIFFKEFYTDTKFVIVNEDGWIRAFDVERREKIFDGKLNVWNARAVFSPDHALLYVAYRRKGSNGLASISLHDFSQTRSWKLPDDVYSGHLQMRGDGHPLLYYHKKEQAGNESQWKHGYAVFDAETSCLQRCEMQYSQRDALISKMPVINLVKNIGVMPCWGDVEVGENGAGELRFLYKIMVFDLVHFKVLQTIAVRTYSTEQLPRYRSTCEEMAEVLIKRNPGEEYEDALARFYEDLYSIAFDENADAVWLCWRNGIVRKVNLNGGLSPQLLIHVKGQDGKSYRPVQAFLECIEHAFLIIETNAGSKHKLDLAAIDLTSRQEYTPVLLDTLDEIIVAENPALEERLRQERGKVVIKVDDLNSPEGLLSALNQMIKLTEDIPALHYCDTLAFLAKDRAGRTLDDSTFFKNAISLPGAAEKIKRVIDNFIRYDKAKWLYIDAEETALCYAVYELARSSPAYIETALRYLAVIDEEHDVFNTEVLIPMLIEVYKGTEYEAAIRKGIEDVSCGWWEEVLHRHDVG